MATRAMTAGRESRGAVLAIGFGTTVAMWAVGYVTHLPPAVTPSWLIGILMLALMFAGGFVAGRYWRRDWRAGLEAGLLSALLNMLVLGSLLKSGAGTTPSALLWLPGALLFGAVLGALGAVVGARSADGARERPIDWTAAFALVAAGATLLLLGVGGLVTSQGAGLAVTDWPNSFGYNMFLYPLSKMTGDVYYEHAHRLFGALVGLTTLVLAVHIARHERRTWVRNVAFGALALVVVQGLLGGLRVTGRLTLSTARQDMAPSTVLAVVHGVTGQLFFALMIAIAVFTSAAWKSAAAPVRSKTASADRTLGPVLVGALVVQLILGAVLRHEGAGLIVHISMATIVAVLAFMAGVRAWGYTDRPPLVRRFGLALIALTGLQLLLGIGAVAAVGAAPGLASKGTLRAVLATPHQVTGAILLGTAVALVLWNRRLVEPVEPAR